MAIEEHINSFSKGMMSDMNVILQPDGTYRYMKNCQLISNTGNNFVIEDCMGNVLKITINTPYNAVYTATAAYCMPIGFISFVDKLIVFSTNDETDDGGYLQIGEINYKPYREGITPIIVTGNQNNGYVPLYHHISLNCSKKYQIEGFAYEENSNTKRVYWTDNFNEPRCINVGDPIFTTYFTPTAGVGDNPLVSGQRYMVLEGAIEHPVGSGFIYGPGLTVPATGNAITDNVFTASSNTYTATTGTTPTPKVIEYYPYELLNFTPSRASGNIKFHSYGVGSKNCGAKMYFYRLTDPANGIKTSWSYGTVPINVLTSNEIAPNPVNPYFNLTGRGTTIALVNSGRSVKLTIDNIDTNFTDIELACAEFDQITDVPRIISIVYSGAITGATMIVEDVGGINLGTLTFSDITLFPATILRCKTMTTNKNYSLIGNLLERQEFEYDTSAITYTEIKAQFPVHETDFGNSATACANVLSVTDISQSVSANPAFIIVGCSYVVTVGTATYNGVVYSVGQVFTGVIGAPTVTAYGGGGQARPCTSKNKYTAINGGGITARPDYIQFDPNNTLSAPQNANFWSYRNPAVASHKKGYWASEKYRYGIMFYDKKGNPMYVKWITDFTFSSADTNSIIENNSTASYDYIFLNQRAIKFSNVRINKSVVDQISGFSIVRAERDKRILSEGLLLQVGGDSATVGTPPIQVYPIGGPRLFQDTSYNYTMDKNYVVICPDNLANTYNPAANEFIEGAFFLTPQDYATPAAGVTYSKAITEFNQLESRYLTKVAADGLIRRNKITHVDNIGEFNGYTNFGASNITFFNQVRRPVFVGGAISGDCLPVPTAPYSFGTIVEGAGGKVSLLEIDTNAPYGIVLQTGGGFGYANIGLIGPEKLVVDFTKENTNQYGGASEAALANTLYISTGHFQPITSQVIIDTNNTNNVNTYTHLTFNDVEIFGGDCYTCLIDNGRVLYNSPTFANTYSWGIKFPCQCNTNYNLRNGRTVSGNMMHSNYLNNGVMFAVGAVSNPESFQYNFGYSSDGFSFNYPSLPLNFKFSSEFKERIRFAGEKFLGESVDSFRVYLTNDYKDLDVQGGEINNIRTKNGRVIVWQNAIVSTVPVLERQILSGLSGAATTLGTGGVVDRYDPISSVYGNQHQQGLTQTEYGYAWFDMRNKAFMVMDIGAGIIEISKIAGLKAYFDEVFIEAEILLASNTETYLNSPTFAADSSRPLTGVGITGVYDTKLKMTYLTFKFRAINRDVNSVPANYTSYINKDFTIGYYHLNKMFIGFFDMTPAISHNHNQIVLSANNPKNKSQYFGTSMKSTTFQIGEVVPWLNSEYIVIAPVTITSYPPAGALAPDFVGSVYFQKINDTSQLWVLNQEIDTSSTEYQYNKFFGQVVNNEVEFIVNPASGKDNPFSALNYQAVGNNVNYTDVYISGQTQSASDLNIRSWNRFFRYIYDRWNANFPLSSTGRITDNYLKVKFVKKNWTTNPTVLTGSKKVLQFVKTMFEPKR